MTDSVRYFVLSVLFYARIWKWCHWLRIFKIVPQDSLHLCSLLVFFTDTKEQNTRRLLTTCTEELWNSVQSLDDVVTSPALTQISSCSIVTITLLTDWVGAVRRFSQSFVHFLGQDFWWSFVLHFRVLNMSEHFRTSTQRLKVNQNDEAFGRQNRFRRLLRWLLWLWIPYVFCNTELGSHQLSFDSSLVVKYLVICWRHYFPGFRWEFYFIQDVGDEFVLVTRRDILISFNHPVFLVCPVCSVHDPNIPSIVSTSLKHPSEAIFGIFFHYSFVWSISPSRNPPLIRILQIINDDILIFIITTMTRHILSAIFSHSLISSSSKFSRP